MMDPKHSWFGGLILGLMLIFFTPISPNQVSCRSSNISAEFRHCGIHPGGVRQLDCFGHSSKINEKNCTWESGRRASGNTYTLVVQQQSTKILQQRYCHQLRNITRLHQSIPIYRGLNMTVEIFENPNTADCTKAVFRGSPDSLLRCGPPDKVSFRRIAGKLDVNVSWQPRDKKFIKNFTARYKQPADPGWTESHLNYHHGSRLRESFNSSLVYVMQIRCVTNDKCVQCPWSEEFPVPSELTTQPVINSFKDTDIADKPGRRLIFLTWKFPAEELCDVYVVTVWKASGEAPLQRIKILQPEITLILSYSAYQLNISAVNNASVSPPLSHVIPQREYFNDVEDWEVNVTVHSNTSFTVYWREEIVKKYVCYMVEWSKKGHPVQYRSFYEKTENHKNFSSLTEQLEPYKKYSLTLHLRPDKDTCNMKAINDSESTYGTTHFYFLQGSPVGAPADISFHNKTVKSVVVQWSSIPEEQIRGFLLGYTIHYSEHHQKGMRTENNITVAPWINRHELGNLRNGRTYQVQISAFTSAGAGVRSAESVFKTNPNGHFYQTGLIIALSVVATVLIFGTPLLKRAKVILWPSMPNLGNSIAVQKIDGHGQLELLEACATLIVEELDTKSLHILEREDVSLAGTLPMTLPLLKTEEDVQESPEIACNWIQTDTESAAGDNLPEDTAEALLDTHRTQVHGLPLDFASDYTTMEMFQQLMPQDGVANSTVTVAIEDKPEDSTALKSMRRDYVRQFSTSPPSDSEHMVTVL
ncbi:interleukin-31 receptor subunit alpha [Nothobranchius furzeri]|uniref:interleukin-31 receptor subunit alpha n=1 Tax=Nothobranchius furzeri TaxID=105023 RepID=UPI003904A8AF